MGVPMEPGSCDAWVFVYTFPLCFTWSTRSFRRSLRQLAFFTNVASGTASAITGVGLFGGVLPLLRRDVDSGLDPVAFGVGRMLADR